MLAGTAPAPFSDDDWLFEIKWDGVRAIATVGTTVSLRSRNDTELAGQFPELAELLIPCTRHGSRRGDRGDERGKDRTCRPSCHGCRRRVPRTGAAPVTYIVFDILRRGDEDLTAPPAHRTAQNPAVRGAGRPACRHLCTRRGPGRGLLPGRGCTGPRRGDGKEEGQPVRARGPERGMAEDPGAEELRLRDCRVYAQGRAGAARRSGPSCWGCTRGGSWSRSGRSGPGFPTGCLQELMENICTAGHHRPAVPRHPREGGLAGAGPCLRGGYHGGDPGTETPDPPLYPAPDRQTCGSLHDRPAHGYTTGRQAAATKAGTVPAPEAKPTLRTYHEKRNFSVTTGTGGSTGHEREPLCHPGAPRPQPAL